MVKNREERFLIDDLSFCMCYAKKKKKKYIWFLDKNLIKQEICAYLLPKMWKIQYLKAKSKYFNEVFEEGER